MIPMVKRPLKRFCKFPYHECLFSISWYRRPILVFANFPGFLLIFLGRIGVKGGENF